MPTPPGWIDTHLVRGPRGWSAEQTRALAQVEVVTAPIPARWGVDGAFWGTFTGQEPAVFSQLAGLSVQRRDAVGRRLLEMGGVTHVASVEVHPYPGLEELAAVESLFDAKVRLFALPSALPRAYAVSGVTVASEPESYALLQGPGFDPRRSVILPQGVPRAPGEVAPGEVRLAWRRSASVGLEAELSSRGTLVLLEAWDPGWTVEVDGEQRPLLRANLIFRGVELEAGRHRVVFRYRPVEAVIGFWTTLTSLVAVAAWSSRREA
jgi:hypothetical protein